MNNRMRQIYKVQLKTFKNDVMAIIKYPGESKLRGVWREVIFIPKDQIEEYKQRYGSDIEIWG